MGGMQDHLYFFLLHIYKIMHKHIPEKTCFAFHYWIVVISHYFASFIWLHSFVCLQDVSGMSLSMLAAAGGQDDILRLLIKKGARVNGRQKNGTTALMHAAEKVTPIKNWHSRATLARKYICGNVHLKTYLGWVPGIVAEPSQWAIMYNRNPWLSDLHKMDPFLIH